MNHPGLVSCMSDIVFAAALAHGALQASHHVPSFVLRDLGEPDAIGSGCAAQEPQPQRYLERLAQALAASDGIALPPACDASR